MNGRLFILIFIIVCCYTCHGTRVYFAVKQKNAKTIYDACLDASRSGSYMTLEDVARKFSNDDAIQKVLDVLTGEKVEVSSGKDFVIWETDEPGKKLGGIDSQNAVPGSLSEAVDFIHIEGSGPGMRKWNAFEHQDDWREDLNSTKGPFAPVFVFQTSFNQTSRVNFAQPCKGGIKSNTTVACNGLISKYVFEVSWSDSLTAKDWMMKNVSLSSQDVHGYPGLGNVKFDFFVASLDNVLPKSFLYVNVTVWAVDQNGLFSPPSKAPITRVVPEVTPGLFRSFMGLPAFADLNETESNSTSVAADVLFGAEYCPDDVDRILELYGVPFRSKMVVNKLANNNTVGCKSLLNSGETNLDLICLATSNPQAKIARGGTVNNTYLDWLVSVATDPHTPAVHSLSYGFSEGEIPNFERCEQELAKLCVRGITVVVAAGDAGVSFGCNNAKSHNSTFNPLYPATSPFVTAVGASCFSDTAVPRKGFAFGESLAAGVGIPMVSGSGFSNRSMAPPWQKAVIQDYLAKAEGELPPKEYFNVNGRVIPDLVLPGHGLPEYSGHVFTTVDGSSGSAPFFAGILSYLNMKLKRKGFPVIGFANPTLYELYAQDVNHTVFYDIVQGFTAPNPALNAPLCKAGFHASPGFDAASGMGGVYANVLIEKLIEVQAKKMHRNK